MKALPGTAGDLETGLASQHGAGVVEEPQNMRPFYFNWPPDIWIVSNLSAWPIQRLA
jgi:hypothetical protein